MVLSLLASHFRRFFVCVRLSAFVTLLVGYVGVVGGSFCYFTIKIPISFVIDLLKL